MMTINEGVDAGQSLFNRYSAARRLCGLLAVFLFLAGVTSCASTHGALSERLHSSDNQTKQSAVKELNTLDRPAKEKHLGTLTKMLYDDNPDNRVLAAESLGHMGPAAEEAVPDLITLLHNQDAELRNNAAVPGLFFSGCFPVNLLLFFP